MPARQEIVGRLYDSRPGEPMAGGGQVVVLAYGEQLPADAPPPLAWHFGTGGFAPTLLVASVGQEIRVVNDDSICHRFFASLEPNTFDLPMMRPGGSGTLRFRVPGIVQVYCSLHGGRQATILVVETPHHALAAANGEFTLEGLPPGRYELETWNDSRPPGRTAVTVSEQVSPFVELVVPGPVAGAPR